MRAYRSKKEEVATSYSWQNRQSSLLGRLIGIKKQDSIKKKEKWKKLGNKGVLINYELRYEQLRSVPKLLS